MPYRYNAITGELDFVVDASASGAITQIDTDSGSVLPAAGVVNLLGDATQGISTSGAGDTATITIADATESQKGVVELATDAESIAGSATTNLAVIPSSLKAKLGAQTQYGVAIGNTQTGAINWSSAGTDGQILIGATGADPEMASLTSTGGSITFTPGTNSLNLEAGSNVPTTFTTDAGSATPSLNVLNVLGGTGISTSAAGNTVTIDLDTPVVVANGGTGLTTITDHAVMIGSGTSAITPVGPVAATGALLASNGVGSDPGFTTATYPLTTTVSEILYSSATNTVTGLATANSAVLTSGATGVPVMTALANDGELIIGSTAGAPAAATLTAGTNVSITNGGNSITIDANAGGQFVAVTLLDNTDTDYTVLSTDYYLSCNVNAGILTIDLPDAGNAGRVVIVKDSGGDAATNNITVTTVTGTDTIDGATTFVMNTNYEAANFIDNGTTWEVF